MELYSIITCCTRTWQHSGFHRRQQHTKCRKWMCVIHIHMHPVLTRIPDLSTCSKGKTEGLGGLKPLNQDLWCKGHRNLCGLDSFPWCQHLRPGFSEMQLQILDAQFATSEAWFLKTNNYENFQLQPVRAYYVKPRVSTKQSIHREKYMKLTLIP